MDTRSYLTRLSRKHTSRNSFWRAFITRFNVTVMCEVGVYRGDFARHILKHCDHIKTYYMIDPWRQRSSWEKPANHDHSILEKYYNEAMRRTEFASHRRVVLRGTTSERIDEIPDKSLDFVYIDGDHTLRGITVDLNKVYPKIKDGGWIAGDDFCPDIWQHSSSYEPTLVFPYAVYFAEAMSNPVYALPSKQFLLHKTPTESYEFIDLAGKYTDLSLRKQLIRTSLADNLRRGIWKCFDSLKSCREKASFERKGKSRVQ